MPRVTTLTRGESRSAAAGIACESVNKVTEGRPHVVGMIKNNEIVMVINTVEERRNAITVAMYAALADAIDDRADALGRFFSCLAFLPRDRFDIGNPAAEALHQRFVDMQPHVLFVGRITRQKGFQHLIRAIAFMERDFQIVLCAAAPAANSATSCSCICATSGPPPSNI